MACKKECFEATVATCLTQIKLKAGLTAATEYFWVITDRFGNLIQRKATTDIDGILIIEVPEGLNQYSGFLNLSIRDGANYLTVVPMVFDAESYDCVMLEMVVVDKADGDTSLLDQIGS